MEMFPGKVSPESASFFYMYGVISEWHCLLVVCLLLYGC